MSRSSRIHVAFALSLAAGALACEPTPTEAPLDPVAPEVAVIAYTGPSGQTVPLIDVPAVTIDLPNQPHPWEESDDVLLDAMLDEAEGLAIVSFKDPGRGKTLRDASGRARTRGRGVRARVSANTQVAALRYLEGRGVAVMEVYRGIGMALVRTSTVEVRSLERHGLVDWVEPVGFGTTDGEVVVAEASASIPIQIKSWGIDSMKVDDAWTTTEGATPSSTWPRLHILDTGYDNDHSELPELNNTDNCASLDTVTVTGVGLVTDGCSDQNGHGTNVAGIIAGLDDFDPALGVVPEIDDEDLYSYATCTASGVCPTSAALAGVTDVVWDAIKFNSGVTQSDSIVDAGDRILNMSWSYDQAFSSLGTAVSLAWDAGAILVGAAGNDNDSTPWWPASYSDVLAVAGVGKDGYRATGSNNGPCSGSSNYGTWIDISAPYYGTSTTNGGGTQTFCGTSAAAPYVAGILYLIWVDNPTWSNEDVVDHLLDTATTNAEGWLFPDADAAIN